MLPEIFQYRKQPGKHFLVLYKKSDPKLCSMEWDTIQPKKSLYIWRHKTTFPLIYVYNDVFEKRI